MEERTSETSSLDIRASNSSGSEEISSSSSTDTLYLDLLARDFSEAAIQHAIAQVKLGGADIRRPLSYAIKCAEDYRPEARRLGCSNCLVEGGDAGWIIVKEDPLTVAPCHCRLAARG